MRFNRFLCAKKALAGVLVGALLVTSAATGNGFFPTSQVVMAASEWNASTTYNKGDEATYNGSTYRAKWWTQGQAPDKSDAWELISSGNTGNNPGNNPGDNSNTNPGGDNNNTIDVGTLNPTVGTNINGVKLPANYYDKKVVGYFPNYAIGSDAHEHFNIADLQWDKLTHVQYAFAVVNKNTCKIEAGDLANDVENRFDDNTFIHKGKAIKMDPNLGYYGQFNIMHTLKKMYPNVTVLISTGGWGASEGLWYATQNEGTMRTFASSAVEFVRKYGFDGIDIDFEFPSETPLSGNYTDFTESIRPGIANRYAQFMKILSEEFSKAAKQDGKYYWLTSAVSASSWVLGGQTNSSFLDYLDFVSIMSYDYHGGWNNYVENQANLYPDDADGETATQAVKTLGFDWSYKFYRGKVQSEKILMGVPYYTRGWTNVSGGTDGLHGSSGTPITNKTDNLNLWCDLDNNGQEVAAGANPLWHVMNVMKQNSNYKYYWDNVGKVPHIWNSVNNTFLTFEDTRSIQERINYVNNHNLGGVLIWVMHGDYDYDDATGKYVVGDTLTTMLYDQFKQAGPSKVTSDVQYDNEAIDFDVDMSGGKYDHPNYTYSIKVKNNSGKSFPAGFKFSFDIPKSTQFTSSWGGTATTADKNYDFTTVTLTSNSALGAGETVEFTGMMKCCFSAAKNFKLDGYSQKNEVKAEIDRLNRAILTEENGKTDDHSGEEIPTETEAPEPSDVDGFATIEAENFTTNQGGVKDPNSNASNGYNMGGITNGVTFTYDNVVFDEDAAAITLQYSSKSADALGNVEVYVDSTSNKVGTVALANTGSSWAEYKSVTGALSTKIAKGTHKIILKFVTTGTQYYVCNLDYFRFVRNSQYNPEVVTNAKVTINGYQISTTAEGYRVIYTVTDKDSEVESAGMIYGLARGCSASDMVIGSSNYYVASYQASEKGKVKIPSIAAPNAQNYAMTMTFDKTAEFFNQKIYVRAYAKLKTGKYIYSDVKSFSVYELAEYMYKKNILSTFYAHNYIYNSILKVVKPDYVEIEYDWNNYYVK